MGIVGSLFGNNEDASNEVENEIVDQVEEQGSEPTEDEVEGDAPNDETAEDHTETEEHEGGDEPADEAPAKPRNMVPGGAIKAERQKRQEAERKAAAYQAELEKVREANRQPDQYSDDPYFEEFRQKMRAEVFEERLLDSDERAREKYGADTVAEAAEWAKSRMAADPTLKSSFLNSRKPIEMLVEQYQKDQKVSALLTDEEAYIRRRAAELGLLANADHAAASDEVETDYSPAVVTKTTAAKPTPRRSLAGGQSQGRATDVPTGRLSAVSSLFK